MTGLPLVAWKLVDATEWAAARTSGAYAGSTVDLADGYIHMSAADQLSATAAKHYAGRSELVLLEVDLSDFGDALKWEVSRGDALFPHLYIDLPLSAVTSERRLSVTPDGQMVFEDHHL